MNVISYQQAVTDQLRFYFNGKPCVNGHSAVRRTANRQCVECDKERKQKTNGQQYLKHREKRLLKALEYRQNNRNELSAKSTAYIKQRRQSDPLVAMKARLASRVRDALLAKGFKKRSRTKELLGCGIEEFKAHIERQFVRGMSWENSSLWHIDHIVPCASAGDENELIALFHFTNLRPVWAKANLAKSSKKTFLI